MSNAKVPVREDVIAVLRSADGRVKRIEAKSGTGKWVWIVPLGAALGALALKIGGIW